MSDEVARAMDLGRENEEFIALGKAWCTHIRTDRSGLGVGMVEEMTGLPITGSLGNRWVWAETPGDHPDGICLDTDGAAWYADVGNQHCVRVREGGEILATVDLDRGAFACALSRGADPHLFVVGQRYDDDASSEPSGQVVAFPAPAPGAGRP